MFDHRSPRLQIPAGDRERGAGQVSTAIGDDTLVWMYERLSYPDRRLFFTLVRPSDRLMFLVNGGSAGGVS